MRASLFLVALLLLGVASAEEWYDTPGAYADCYAFFSVEVNADPSAITSAARRILMRTHPDRCATDECREKYALANNCKDTLKDPLRRRSYDGRREDVLAGRHRVTFHMGPRRTPALLVSLFVVLIVSYVQYSLLRTKRQEAHDKEARAIVARKRDTPAVMEQLKRDYQLDSPWALVRELFVYKAVLAAPGVLVKAITGGIPQLASVYSSLSKEAAPPKNQTPNQAAQTFLMWKALRFVIYFVVLTMAWGYFTSYLGTRTPFFVVTDNQMSRGHLMPGDLLLMTWGREAIDALAAGDIIAYRFWEEDPNYTLSRVMAVHKEGNSAGVRVVNGDSWIMTKADGHKSNDRQKRGLSDTSEDQYVNGRDESYPGRAWAKIPYVGMFALLVGGDGTLLVYTVVLIYWVSAILMAGAEARKARTAKIRRPGEQ